MQIEVFTIADAATISGGKLNLLGSFDRLMARQFPAQHHACVVVTKLRLSDDDSGHHELRIRIIDPDGNDVIQPAQARFSPQIEFGQSGHHTHLWHIHGFPIPKAGVFYIDAIVNGRLLARTPLFVEEAKPHPTQQ